MCNAVNENNILEHRGLLLTYTLCIIATESRSLSLSPPVYFYLFLPLSLSSATNDKPLLTGTIKRRPLESPILGVVNNYLPHPAVCSPIIDPFGSHGLVCYTNIWRTRPRGVVLVFREMNSIWYNTTYSIFVHGSSDRHRCKYGKIMNLPFVNTKRFFLSNQNRRLFSYEGTGEIPISHYP